MNVRIFSILTIFVFAVAAMACDPPDTDGEADDDGEVTADGPSGIDDGGISDFPELDDDLVAEGEDLFRTEGCVGCHQMDSDGAGPALGDVTDRRNASWIARVIMHPDQMRDQDPEFQAVGEDFPAPMPATNVSPEAAEAIIAYLKSQ